jgi:hypothetical protein
MNRQQVEKAAVQHKLPSKAPFQTIADDDSMPANPS